jgi:hypothetical protein
MNIGASKRGVPLLMRGSLSEISERSPKYQKEEEERWRRRDGGETEEGSHIQIALPSHLLPPASVLLWLQCGVCVDAHSSGV